MAIKAIVPAAGTASRYGKAKLYEQLAGNTVIGHTLETLIQEPAIEQIIVAIQKNDHNWQQSKYHNNSKISTTAGGDSRAKSVLNALNAIQGNSEDWILVHDAARPCLSKQDLQNLISTTERSTSGAILAAPVYDTIKQAIDHKIIKTVIRDNLWRALTPQMFRYQQLKDAISTAINNNSNPSDEAQAMELTGVHPTIVQGSSDNIKITCAQDLPMAEAILAKQ